MSDNAVIFVKYVPPRQDEEIWVVPHVPNNRPQSPTPDEMMEMVSPRMVEVANTIASLRQRVWELEREVERMEMEREREVEDIVIEMGGIVPLGGVMDPGAEMVVERAPTPVWADQWEDIDDDSSSDFE